jgi:hypothetical protein
MTIWSPGRDIEPFDPPLNARNPANRIMPPMPVSCRREPSVSSRARCEFLNLLPHLAPPRPRPRPHVVLGYTVPFKWKNLLSQRNFCLQTHEISCSKYVLQLVQFCVARAVEQTVQT